MSETPEQIADKLTKIAKCIYIAAEEPVARDISQTCLEAAAALRRQSHEAASPAERRGPMNGE